MTDPARYPAGLTATWTGRTAPLPITGEQDLRAAVEAVARLVADSGGGEMLALDAHEGPQLAVWIDAPERGGWALSWSDQASGRTCITGSAPLTDAEPEIDVRYYDAWNPMPAGSFLSPVDAWPAVLEFLRTHALPTSVPWRDI